MTPLILKEAIDAMMCKPNKLTLEQEACKTEQETYTLVALYVIARLVSEFINNMREIPYGYMAAYAEVQIASDVYNHIQRQSLSFHLSRETGKIIRVVSRGSQGFERVLRHMTFNILPLAIECVFTLGVYAFMFDWRFMLIQLAAILLYTWSTFTLTERRAKNFRRMNNADSNYNQKATDSLLNFETVKYFNAEKHEEARFDKAVTEYVKEKIAVAISLVPVNTFQSAIISMGLSGTLLMAYKFILSRELSTGGFVMFNSYNMQIYNPLSFLGYLWKEVR